MKTLLAGIALSLIASVSSAATISIVKVTTPIDTAAAQADVLAPTATTGTVLSNVTGSVHHERRSPFDTIAGLANTGKYNSIQAGGSATYTFDQAQNGFSLLWGSPDTYNTLSFFNGNTQIDLSNAFGVTGMAVNGGEIAALAAAQVQARGFAQVLFSGFTFDKVVMASQQNAFEYGLVEATPAPVPLPAAAWMLLAGLGALGLASRRTAAA